jgi:2-methylcitrate dehydratase PrpD
MMDATGGARPISATRALARHTVRTEFRALPQAVIWEGKRRIADVIGAALSGSTTAVGARIAHFCNDNARPGEALLWGSKLRASPAYAALANGTAAFHLELDDVHRTSHTHPGVTTIPAAIALAEEKHLSGRDMLVAVVLGYDAQIRVGLAVSPSIYTERTYLAPGTLGIFGATAAAAKLLKLDEDATAGALGAASYVGPLAPFESFCLGAPAKDTIMGWANFCGLYAAGLAAQGFGGPESALEGDYGFCRTVAQHYDMDRLHDALGTRFDILHTGVKPYACCRQHHSAIDAVLELKERYGLVADQVESVRLRTFVVASRGTAKQPASVPAAKYSAPYTIALALALGQNQREQYSMELIGDAKLLRLAARVEVEADMELEALYDEKWPSIVEVKTKDGRVLSARRDLPKGEPEYPVSDADLKSKFLSLACDAVSRDRAESIWSAIARLEEMSDVSELTALLQR